MKEVLDSFDLKLISCLELNANLPVVTLAKNLSSERHKVKYRMKRLERLGVIESYRTIINNYLIDGGFFALVSVKSRIGMVDKLIEAFLKSDEVFSIYVLSGEYDLELVSEFHSKEDYNRFLEKLNHIEGIEKTRNEIFLKYHLLGKDVMSAPSTSGKLGSIDRNILKLIRFNARAPKKWIAEKLEIPISSLSRRIRQLERLGVICGYYAVVDYSKLGFFIHVSVRLNVDPQEYDHVLSKVLELRPLYAAELIGETDMHFRFYARDPLALRKLVRSEIGQTEGIQRMSTYFITRSYHRGPQ